MRRKWRLKNYPISLSPELMQQLHMMIASHFKQIISIPLITLIFRCSVCSDLKNIYALGAGIAHGLEYGDNFLSVLIANSADEMAGFLRKAGIQNIEVGSIEHDGRCITTK